MPGSFSSDTNALNVLVTYMLHTEIFSGNMKGVLEKVMLRGIASEVKGGVDSVNLGLDVLNLGLDVSSV